jgi:hypothetical protein
MDRLNYQLKFNRFQQNDNIALSAKQYRPRYVF